MNKTTIVAALIVCLSGAIGAAPFVLDETSVSFHNEQYNTSITVVEDSGNNTSLGLNSDRNLDFGDIPQGSNATKFLNMSTGEKSILSINSEGNISEFLEYEKNMYFEGSKRIELEMKGREPGNYTGNLSLQFEIPKSQVGSYWLDLKYEIYKLL